MCLQRAPVMADEVRAYRDGHAPLYAGTVVRVSQVGEAGQRARGLMDVLAYEWGPSMPASV
ncbi:hypothetical protein ABIE00_002796 [Arthrobacter sp. OAP107]